MKIKFAVLSVDRSGTTGQLGGGTPGQGGALFGFYEKLDDAWDRRDSLESASPGDYRVAKIIDED